LFPIFGGEAMTIRIEVLRREGGELLPAAQSSA
jgi:hypothetical protein